MERGESDLMVTKSNNSTSISRLYASIAFLVFDTFPFFKSHLHLFKHLVAAIDVAFANTDAYVFNVE